MRRFIYFSLVSISLAGQLTDSICQSSTSSSSSFFCQKLKEHRRISSEGVAFSRSTRQENKTEQEKKDDPSCKKLKDEYDQVCFTPPPAQALIETKAFCDAFVETCSSTLKTNLFTHLEDLKVDFSAYCKRQKERFRYVCPQPLRFHSFADDALEFCARYRDRCPDVIVPTEPDAGHIYIREVEVGCRQGRRMARNYCTDPDLLKVPKYALPCAIYKYQCIDIYQRVIYG